VAGDPQGVADGAEGAQEDRDEDEREGDEEDQGEAGDGIAGAAGPGEGRETASGEEEAARGKRGAQEEPPVAEGDAVQHASKILVVHGVA
jgi:hypothetical protein